MINALAPTMSRGCWWVWASIALVGAFPLAVHAQTNPAPKEAGAAEAPPKAEEPPADEAAEPEPKAPTVELYEEPAAQAAAENNFKELSAGSFNPRDIRTIEGMARGGAVNADLIQRYVSTYAAALTNHKNIQAMLTPDQFPPNSSASRGIREAGDRLLTPVELARKARNAAFLKAYTLALLKQAPDLLSNHLFARIETIIVLAQTTSPEAIDFYIKQLTDKDQTVWVQQWAARGITNVMHPDGGYLNDIPGAKSDTATKAARALAGLLARDDLPWPVQLRVVEALGSLRLAADPAAQAKVEFATAVMQILANPDIRPEVRAEAAWALSMMRVSLPPGQFNYGLIAYYLGGVAADLGEGVAAEYADNENMARYWASPLIYQLYSALNGQEGARDSGLLHMQLTGPQKKTVQEVADLVKPIAKSSIELFKSARAGREKIAKDLSARVGQLRSYLDKNPPAQKELVAGGVAFRVRALVDGAPVNREQVAGAAPGR
jgi:hypothetical protein